MYTQLSAPLTHSLLLLGGCSVQQASLWSRLVYRLWSKGLRREDYPEREHSSLGFRRAQMAHSEAGGLKQELGEEKKKSERCRQGARAVWGEEPRGHWQSIQMEAILQPLKGMACKCTHSLLPTRHLHLLHLMYEWSRAGERGWDEEGGGRRMMWWRRGRQSLCVLWSLSYGFSLSGLSPGTLRESGSGRHPHSHNPRLSSSIQGWKVSLRIVNSSQRNLWHSHRGSDMWTRHSTAAWTSTKQYTD